MKNTRTLYCLIALAALCFPVQPKAQEYKNFSLISRYGLGVEESYASGGSPLVYGGVAAKIGLDFRAEWKRYRIACEQQFAGGIDFNSKSNDRNIPVGYHGKIDFLYHGYSSPNMRFHWWAGGGIGDRFRLLYNAGLGNASTAAFNFLDADFCSEVSYHFSFRKNLLEKPFSAYAGFSLPLFSWMRLPGFPYMTDYIMGKNTFILADKTYENHFSLLTGISTEIGLSYTLQNRNRIALSYFWEYCSSGKTADCRLDHAQHFLQCAFTFNLKYNA